MQDRSLGAIEARFADIIWDNEPISSTELARRAEALLGWKKSTSYTVLKRLCDKGIFQNVNGSVSAALSREDFYAAQSQRFVDETFDGSLPAFVAAFTRRKPLSAEEAAQLRQLIAAYEEG